MYVFDTLLDDDDDDVIQTVRCKNGDRTISVAAARAIVTIGWRTFIKIKTRPRPKPRPSVVAVAYQDQERDCKNSV